ncbi:polo kinase CDC5 [Rhizophagus irregularis DAOM 197198w]|uniref:Polo kinase CDC5 n=1 Tax=Rhizophagus irregularis (strain DAOM 197198w) TaxID=1432141 RepID=A0A015J794_RHIIW|nr:polo kinase CDC5 [Rhizophagus irregularis DAOM 197198w]
MAIIRQEIVRATINRAAALVDPNIQNNLEKRHVFRIQTVLADKSLTKDEKSYAVKELNKVFDHYKILYNEGTKRICENCHDECLATLYCEHSLIPNLIVEWIPYNNLQNIKYLTKGGSSEIYTAVWIGGCYEEWDLKEKQLKRYGSMIVVLKKLENVESANKSWFDEGISHLHISSKTSLIVQCYGLTQNPFNGNYMIVMNHMNINLREYLQQNLNKITWKERIQIIDSIIGAVYDIHSESSIHRDLHSGNILFGQSNQNFFISDFGFCGPANKPLNSIYGNLPYIAPEVIVNKKYTFASDIYSIGILMWEISSGQPPFINKHDYDLAIRIINGMRPKTIPDTPLEYKELMEQCWDANPTKRPDIFTLFNKIRDIYRWYCQNENEQRIISKITSTNNSQLNTRYNLNSSSTNSSFFGNFSTSSSNWNISSRVYNFENLPEPKNATKGKNFLLYKFYFLHYNISFYLFNRRTRW